MDAVFDDWRRAPVDQRVRAALEFLTKLVPPQAELGPDDVAKLRRAGLSAGAIRDVMYASWCFQNLSRWADAFGWPLPTEQKSRLAAKMLHRLGYRRASV